MPPSNWSGACPGTRAVGSRGPTPCGVPNQSSPPKKSSALPKRSTPPSPRSSSTSGATPACSETSPRLAAASTTPSPSTKNSAHSPAPIPTSLPCATPAGRIIRAHLPVKFIAHRAPFAPIFHSKAYATRVDDCGEALRSDGRALFEAPGLAHGATVLGEVDHPTRFFARLPHAVYKRGVRGIRRKHIRTVVPLADHMVARPSNSNLSFPAMLPPSLRLHPPASENGKVRTLRRGPLSRVET